MRASLISTDTSSIKNEELIAFQCPKRASLISTVSLPNPLKSMVLGTISARNYQNILTIVLTHLPLPVTNPTVSLSPAF